MLSALCAQVDPDLWFPKHEGDNGTAAIKICGSCPVLTLCLTYAVENNIEYGVWGGMSANQRVRMRKAIA